MDKREERMETDGGDPGSAGGLSGGDISFDASPMQFCSTSCDPSPNGDYYKMDGRKIAVIINMNNCKTIREGSEADVEKIEKAFKRLNFDTIPLLDRNKFDLMEELKQIAKNKCKGIDCVAVVIMTHGGSDEEGEYFESVGGHRFRLKEVEELFLPGECPALKGKPKLFFIQACRGKEITDSFECKGESTEEPRESDEIVYRIPKSCDVLEFFSTEEGTKSARIPSSTKGKEGTWFIERLSERLTEYGHREPLINICTRVIDDIAHYKEGTFKDESIKDGPSKVFKQQPVLVSRLRKLIHFGHSKQTLEVEVGTIE